MSSQLWIIYLVLLSMIRTTGSASSACVGELGMLSNCPCTFCLPCIRGWRANPVEIKGGAAGTVIPKSTQHVRY